LIHQLHLNHPLFLLLSSSVCLWLVQERRGEGEKTINTQTQSQSHTHTLTHSHTQL
jgi:hypothetical protein